MWTSLLFICCTMQHKVVYNFFYHLYHKPYNVFPYCVCLFLALSCSVFGLAIVKKCLHKDTFNYCVYLSTCFHFKFNFPHISFPV